MANNIIFYYGQQTQFDAVASKDTNALYFIEDSQRIYKGQVLIADASSNKIEFVGTLPSAADAVEGKIYVVTNEDGSVSMYTKNGAEMAPVSADEVADGAIKNLNAFAAGVIKTSTGGAAEGDGKIPTVAAVEEAIAGQIENSGAFVSVVPSRAEDNSGTVLTFTSVDGTETPVTITDLFLSAAEYNAETHMLSLTVSGVQEPVKVNLEDLVPSAATTKTVAMSENITVTTAVGNFKKGDVIDVSQITNVQDFFVKMLCQDSNPIATQPSVTITLNGAKPIEVGTTYTPSWSVSFNAGKYVANGKTQATNVTVETYSITDSKSATADTSSGTFNAFTVMDDTDYYVSCSVNHTAGDIPKTYLGEDYAAAQIKAGTKTDDSLHVTGYRQGFFGALEAKNGEINSALIRGLVGKTNKKVEKGQQYTITVPAGVLRIVLAYEASVGDVASITSAEEFGSEIKDSFTKSVVSVLDASGANGKDYNVYVKDLAGAQGTDTTYTVTI